MSNPHPTDWDAVVEYFQNREDRLERIVKEAVTAATERSLEHMRAYTLERELALIRRFEEQSGKLKDIEFSEAQLKAKTERLFSMTDDLRDKLVPEVKEIKAALERLLVEQDRRAKDCTNHQAATQALKDAQILQDGQKEGFKFSWSFMASAILFLVAVATFWVRIKVG